MFVKFDAGVLGFFYTLLLLLLVFVLIYLFLGYIYLHLSLYIVCVSYQLNVRYTMEIRRSLLCDYFLVLLFITDFLYKIMCCK